MMFVSKPDNERIKEAIAFISQLDSYKEWEITIKPYKKNITKQQRNYWHDLLGIIGSYVGYSIDDLKTRMCFTMGLTRNVTLKSGETIQERKSTEKLTREEYSNLIEAAQIACLELGLTYPDPRDLGLEIRKNK